MQRINNDFQENAQETCCLCSMQNQFRVHISIWINFCMQQITTSSCDSYEDEWENFKIGSPLLSL